MTENPMNENEPVQDNSVQDRPAQESPVQDKRVLYRRFLMLAGIAIVAAASAWFYFTSDRYISTNNAYIKAAKIMVTPQVTGTIESVAIDDNEEVDAGDVLFVIDSTGYKIAVDKAKADLAESYAKIKQLKAEYRQKKEDMARAQITADFANREYERKNPLASKGAVSPSILDEAGSQQDATVKSVSALKEEINGILAELADDPNIKPEDHPLYQKALAVLNEAELNFERTTVVAPVKGMVASSPNVGDYARAGVPLVNLVVMDNTWIEANFKETELTHMKIGQPVDIEIDTYPGSKWTGKVDSISPATGSEFAILPAQNATGNWVKVVQRIGVRIAIDSGPEDLLLHAGMSAEVTIDTGRYPHLSSIN